MLNLKVREPLTGISVKPEQIYLLHPPPTTQELYFYLKLEIQPDKIIEAEVKRYNKVDGELEVVNGRSVEITEYYYYNSETLEPYLVSTKRSTEV